MEVKPIGIGQWERQTYYLYGVIEPKTGNSFFYEESHLDTECFEKFLQQFSQSFPEELHILQVDNAPFHKAKNLILPENIVLLFQPSYCPELNPIKRFWQHLKSFLSWRLFTALDDLRAKVREILDSFTRQAIASLTGWEYILQTLSVAGI